jgi:hypothetical protein
VTENLRFTSWHLVTICACLVSASVGPWTFHLIDDSFQYQRIWMLPFPFPPEAVRIAV